MRLKIRWKTTHDPRRGELARRNGGDIDLGAQSHRAREVVHQEMVLPVIKSTSA